MPPVKKPKPEQRCRTFLKEWREHRGLTLGAAAERVDMHYTSLARIERGQSPYNQDFLERAAEVYGCEVTDLLTSPPDATNIARKIYAAIQGAEPERQLEVFRVVRAMLGLD